MNNIRMDFISKWNHKYNKIQDIFKKEFDIDNDYIYCIWLDKRYKYKIDDIVKIKIFKDKMKDYIYSLKNNDEIELMSFCRKDIGKIKRISYKKKNKNIISSISVSMTNDYDTKIKIKDIVYNDIHYEMLVNVLTHYYRYLFFDKYVINESNEIIEKLK